MLDHCFLGARAQIKAEVWIKIQLFSFFIQENDCENTVCKMAAILYRPKCINTACYGIIDVVHQDLK